MKWELGKFELLQDKQLEINWGALLPPRIGTKHQRHTLLASAKQLLELYCGQSHVLPKQYAKTTILRQFSELRVLIRWMAMHGVWKFSDFSFASVVLFICERRPRKSSIDACEKKGILAERTVEKWVGVFRFMWEMRGRYDHAFTVDPHALSDEVLARIRTRTNRAWRGLSEEIALELIKDALQWINDFSPFLLDVATQSWERSRKTVAWSKDERSAESKRFYTEISSNPRYVALHETLNYSGPVYKTVSVALSVTEGACVFLLLALVGFRASELLSLNRDCLVLEYGPGDFRMGYLRGIAAKQSGRSRRWIADVPVEKVIETLLAFTKFTSAGTRKVRSNALLLNRSTGSPLFWVGSKPERWGWTTLQNRLCAFACSGLRKNKVHVAHLHPHMLRKTFAQLAVLRDKSMLDAVSAQLGHAYRLFTDDNYVGMDHSLVQLIKEEDRKELARGLETLLTCRAVGGKAAAGLDGVRAQVAKFHGRRMLVALIETLIEKGVVLAPCDWGFCVYSRDYSACGGDGKGPNAITRSPDVCAGCQNLFVTGKHLLWWSDRARDQQEFLKRKNIPLQSREIAEKKLKKTREVLARIIEPDRAINNSSDDRF
ncbi:site-specific integrase [Burkholderia gladioli]|uniref:site-specific integrase n=1 Tax=Burkholderia gladioli TaxID=28095 RepID=UPI00163EA8EC|nr:site-specific integrase [Burkholderia gladioli]